MTKISLSNMDQGFEEVVLMDAQGKDIAVIHNEKLNSKIIQLNATNLPSGTYIIKVKTSKNTFYKRMSVVQ